MDGIENSSSVSYELDKPYTSMRNGIEETTVCSRLNENLLIYNSKVPANGWNIGKWFQKLREIDHLILSLSENSTLFTPEGIVSTIRNLNTNVTTTKYYRRSDSEHISDGGNSEPTSPKDKIEEGMF